MEKSANDIDEKILKSTVVIVDIEGTTTSIKFVKDTLFPYAAEKAAEFLTSNWEAAGVQEAVEGMRQQAAKDIEEKIASAVAIPAKDADKEAQIEALASSVKWLVSTDSKAQHFKQLSGLIWEKGYQAGELKGHLYKDVQPALESWRAAGRRIYVYSSGSVQAQQLLMKHSEHGDLLSLFDGNFDTAVGNKQEKQSYLNIIEKIDCKVEDALFLTDVVNEGLAAREAGLNVALLVREGNAPLTDEDKTNFTFVESFADIPLAAAATKRKPETPEDEQELPPAKLAKTAPEKEVIEKEVEAIKPEENKVTEAVEVVMETDETEAERVDEESHKTIIDKDQMPQAMETDCAPAQEETLSVEIAAEKMDVVSDKVLDDIVVDKIEEKTEIAADVVSETDKPNNEAADEKSDAKIEPETTVAVDNVDSEVVKSEEEPVKEEMEIVVPVEEKTESKNCPKPKEASIEKEEEVLKVAENNVDTVTEASAVLPAAAEEEAKLPDLELIENGVTDTSEGAPIVEGADDKLDDLLGEEGAALEKECAEILFKVDKEISSTETLIQKCITQPDRVEIESEEPVAEEVSNVAPLDKSEPSESILDTVSTDKIEVSESIPDVVLPEPDTPKDENPSVEIEEKPVAPAPMETEPEPEIAKTETETANDKDVAVPIVEESNSKVDTDVNEIEDTASIKTNGASSKESTNGASSKESTNGDTPEVEERVNGKSCTETNDNRKNSTNTSDQNGDTKEEDKESDEKTNGATVEKKPHGWTADTGIPCEQE